MIRLKNIRYRYPGVKSRWILDGIDLSVERGEYVFVCGASGSGKSTLGYLFNGLIPHFFEGELQGRVFMDGRDVTDEPVSERFGRVGLVMQNADAQLFNSSVESDMAYGLESMRTPPEDIDERIRETAKMLDIEHLLDRSPMNLSGGEKRLAAVASVLCMDPDVLLLDEPYAHLDWAGTARVRRAISAIHSMGKTVIVIEHRSEGVIEDAGRCVVMSMGKIAFDGHPLEAAGTIEKEGLVPNYFKKQTRLPLSFEPLIEVKDLTFKRDGVTILENISFQIKQGRTVAVVGRNGSGKTTLAKHLNGLLQPASGEVLFMDEPIRKAPPAERAEKVGIAFQNANDQFFKYRVRDEFLAGPRQVGLVKKSRDPWPDELIQLSDLFRLEPLLDRSPYKLSEGEKKRVALASILAMGPKLIVLDEPTVGQDGRFREALARLLKKLEDRGYTSVVITHDFDFARAVADRWIVLHQGRITADGAPGDIMDDPRLIEMGAVRGSRKEPEGVADATERSGKGMR